LTKDLTTGHLVYKESHSLFTVDEEGQRYKELADSRAKLLEVHQRENDNLKMRNFELAEENYNLIRNREDGLEIIEQAKRISAILNVS
jgi:hypothetical protein